MKSLFTLLFFIATGVAGFFQQPPALTRVQADRLYAATPVDVGYWTGSKAYRRGNQYVDINGMRRTVSANYTSGSTFGALDLANTVATSGTIQLANSMVPLYAPKGNEFFRWQSALAQAATGGSPAIITAYGDSITAGLGATTPSRNDYGYVGRLRSKFEALYGNGGDGTLWLELYSVNDYPGLTLGGQFATGRTGGPFNSTGRWSTSTADAITLTATCDKFIVGYRQATSQGSFSWAIDGGSATTVSADGSNALPRLEIAAGALGSHTLTLKTVTGSPTFYYIEPIVSTGKVRVNRCGKNGATAASLALSGSSTASVNVAWATGTAPNLSLVFMGTNDFFNSVTIADFKTALTTIAQTAKAQNSSVCFVTPFGVGSQQNSDTGAYQRAVFEVADAQGCAVFDLGRLWRAGNNTNPLIGGDGTHPTDAGYEFIAARLFAALNLL